MTWYNTLNKPLFTPPAQVFTPAWIVLYILISISFIIYANTKTTESKAPGYIAFFMQLILNFSWSPIFFGLKNLEFAFVIIIFMLILIALTIVFFFRISKLSAILLIPYLLWVIFATYLNYGFMTLN